MNRGTAVWGLLVGLSLLPLGCATICDDVAEEAEASGCAAALPEDEDAELPECEGDREKRAECLLDFSDNVCFLTDDEALAVQACMDSDL